MGRAALRLRGDVSLLCCHPQEAWLLSRERELREEVRKERDKEIELVIQRLEADMSSAKEECERAAENRWGGRGGAPNCLPCFPSFLPVQGALNMGWGAPSVAAALGSVLSCFRIKRIRDKYEVELQELERSERKLQERCNDLKGRLVELEGESIRLQGLLKNKEQEAEEIRKVSKEQGWGSSSSRLHCSTQCHTGVTLQVRDQLSQERSSLTEVIRQEFADRLMGMEEENKRLKAEMVELCTRQRLELDRVVRQKDRELEEVHRR